LILSAGVSDTACQIALAAYSAAVVHFGPKDHNMNTPEHFEIMDAYARYRLSGHGSLAEAAGKVIEAITFAREQGIPKLLIDTTKWTGHDKPDTLERFHFAQVFTEAARSAVKLAMVVRPELMDPRKFEVTVAKNRGLNGNVFDSEKDALIWLLDPKSDQG
jgi:hypothetical protein